MTDGEREILRVLTAIRDAQREEIELRRRALDESLALSRRAIRLQRLGLLVGTAVIAAGVALLALRVLVGR